MKITMPSLGFKAVVIGYMIFQWLSLMAGIDLIISTIFFAIMVAFALAAIDAYKRDRDIHEMESDR